MQTFTVSFFGHREIRYFQDIEAQLIKIIRELGNQKSFVEFLVGRNGDFDHLVSSAIRRIEKEDQNGNIAHVLVLPYLTAEFRNNEEAFYQYYDEIEICTTAAEAHFKAAIQKRNREMVDRSDLVIFYVENQHGGAYRTMQYAKQQQKNILNLAKEQ